METIRIGVICPSEIAFRRFLPSLKNVTAFQYMGVAIADRKEWDGNVADEVIKNELRKANTFLDEYGGTIYHSYHDLITSPEIDAVYIPLPPALHFQWAKLALENGKHVFVEKPSTTSSKDSEMLISIAKEKGLVLHENYMFQYHSQIADIKLELESGIVGRVHSYHARFGFPMRQINDFRYNKELGGGALLDAGGYVIKLATKLLGRNIKMESCVMNSYDDFNVDLYGSYMFRNEYNQVFIGEFGMDCEYQCNLSVWGSKGILNTNRIFTAPDDLLPVIEVLHNNEIRKKNLSSDSHFQKSIRTFYEAVHQKEIRERIYDEIKLQAQLVDQARKLAERE